MLTPSLPAPPLNRLLPRDEVFAYWYWDSELPQRLHVTLFAAGEVVFGAFYQLTAPTDLVNHMLGS